MELIMEQFPIVIQSLNVGFLQTLKLFFVTLLGALPLGLIIAFGSMSHFRPLKYITNIIVWVVRGTPLMIQMLIIYYFPGLVLNNAVWGGGESGRFVAASVAFIFNYACYFSVIYRGGIQSVPQGQTEAGLVLGMTKSQIFFKITLMQMIKRIVPPMSNEIITLVKDTSLARIIALQEIIWAGQAFLKGSQGISGAIWFFQNAAFKFAARFFVFILIDSTGSALGFKVIGLLLKDSEHLTAAVTFRFGPGPEPERQADGRNRCHAHEYTENNENRHFRLLLASAQEVIGHRLLLCRQWLDRFRHKALASAKVDVEGTNADQEQTERSKPQNCRGKFERRLVKHKVPIAVDHVVNNFLIGFAGFDLFDHLVAQVNGKFRIGLRNRLILADETAQLLGHLNDALVRYRIKGRRRSLTRSRLSGLSERQCEKRSGA